MSTATPTSPTAPGRRAANRSATVAAIKAAALRQVAEEGAPALSIRGVARAVGISPAGLYRYYDSRDALLTDLLVDAYNDLADAVTAAGGLPVPASKGAEPRDVAAEAPEIADPLRALLEAITAYRSWAVGNPTRFLLLFGTPVPGYAAPPDGPTVAANRRMGQAFFTLAALAWRADLLSVPEVPPDTAPPPDAAAPDAAPQPDAATPDAAPQQYAGAPGAAPLPHRADPRAPAIPPSPREVDLLNQLRQLAPGFPAALIPRMLSGWALWHGLVTLEITGQLHWIYPDAEAFYVERATSWVRGFAAGLT